MLTNRTSGFWKMVRDAVVKSEYRVPMPITTSASRGERVRGRVAGGADRAERSAGGRSGSEPLPAWVSATGMPVASTNARSASLASA